MVPANYMNREGFLDASGTYLFFGHLGYVDIVDDVIVAHITRSSAKLGAYDFSDMASESWKEPQELEISKLGLKGILDYLRVPRFAKLQKKLTTYIKHKKSIVIVQSNPVDTKAFLPDLT